MTSPTPHLDQLNKDGFVLIRSILTPAQLSTLRTAAESITLLARSGAWPHVRVVGKQFPPWDSNLVPTHGIWGVQHLMNPSLPSGSSTTFSDVYFSDAILDIVKELLQCSDDDLVMELFNMLVRPDTRDFELRWHRDDIPPETSPEEELERLRSEKAWHAQYNLSLFEDDSLIVVPGSHLRARTDIERAADPFEGNMPGQLVVKLEPGDVVFYNNNILHRGAYKSDKERMTLHGSVGHVNGSEARARNVLQHGVGSWVESCDLTNISGGLEKDEEKMRVRKRAEGMRARLLSMGKQKGEQVEYSLKD